MTSEHKRFRVLIVGGGIAGLSLALMLEKFDIDYLLLEAYGDIAPQVGASIGMNPNGLRILDQIDCYEPLLKFVGDLKETVNHTRDQHGRPFISVPGFPKHLELRHGYPIMFFDRQLLLKTLYENLKHPERIILNEKVVRAELLNDGVEVHTGSDHRFHGSLVVGADGLHSIVRQEIRRLGSKTNPESFPPDEKAACYYLCSFGIAQDVPAWVEGEQNSVTGHGHSQLVVSGPEGRVYWFFFSQLPEVAYGDDIPKCTKGMEKDFVERYRNTPITERVKFGDVFDKRVSSTLTPLHEFVCKTWHFDRMVIIGDSAHKPNPIGGQGGNNAIESAASLINAILKKRHSLANGLENLDGQDVADILEDLQKTRHERAERIVWVSHLQQALNAFEKKLVSYLLWNFYVPMKGSEASLGLFGLTVAKSARINSLPLRKRPRAIPYNDELPSKPLEKSGLVKMAFLISMIAVAANSIFSSQDSDLPPRSGQSGFMTYEMYSLSQLLSPILITVIEGYRIGNRGTLLGLPTFSLAMLHWRGVGLFMPLFALLLALQSTSSPTGRYIRPEAVVSLLSSLVLAFLLPLGSLILTNDPSPKSQTEQAVLESVGGKPFWGLLPSYWPVLVAVLTYMKDRLMQKICHACLTERERRDLDFDRYKADDVPLLTIAYSSVFIVQAVSHWTFLLSQDEPSVASYAQLLNPFAADPTLGTEMRSSSAACLLISLFSIWAMRSSGYVEAGGTTTRIIMVIAGHILCGPGAIWAAVWCWKDVSLKRVMNRI